MKIAYFSPVSPQKTGISDYTERELLPHLSKYVDLDIFIDEKIIPNNENLKTNFHIYTYKEFENMKDRYDIVLYHMGNNKFHEYIYNTLIRTPGITILHDIYLHGFLWNISLARGNSERYIEEFRYCYGQKGEEIAKNSLKSGESLAFRYPLIKKIVDNSVGIISHSDFGLKKVLEEDTSPIATKINHPITIPNEIKSIEMLDVRKIKEMRGIANKTLIITSFGFISDHKRYNVLLKSFNDFLKDYPQSLLLLVGDDLMGIDKLISDMNLKMHVIKTGYVAFDKIVEYLSISDFCVNLRYPTAGETSGSILRIMAAGKPVIVSNVGWFSEIPDNCCLKVDVDSYEEKILLEYMKLLASDEKFRTTIGKNAQKYVIKEHGPEKIAKDYYKFIINVLNGNEIMVHNISEKLIELGIGEGDDNIIQDISKIVHELQ